MSAESISLTGKILGATLFYPPGSQEVQPLVALLKSSDWAPLWPCGTEDAKAQATEMLSQTESAEESIDDAYQRLFIGPYALPAHRGVQCIWIKNRWCLVIPRWHYVSGCAKTISGRSLRRQNLKTISD